MKTITCPVSSVPTPVISVREPREVKNFEGIDQALNYLVSTRDIAIYSEMSTLAPSIATNMKSGDVTELPETVSYQLKRGFLNITSTGSIFHKNNNQKINVGYLNDDGLPMLHTKGAEHLMRVTA
jgi:hypothetical protein